MMSKQLLRVVCCLVWVWTGTTSVLFAKAELGQVPPVLELSEQAGGRVDGSAWSSHELKGKVHLLVYSSPGKKEANNKATEAIKAERFAADTFSSVAVVNMKASMIPDFLIARAIKKKQRDYPRTLYVKDAKRKLVDSWGFEDDENVLAVFDKTGALVYKHAGSLPEKDIPGLLRLIKEKIAL
ncbi:MAG: transcriptional regulator [Zetaproteobacteria bacterium]|nr:transcriptional regulator [Zetaproteobacteria bacterium]